MHGVRRSQISSSGQRARPQTIVSSKLAFTNIYGKLRTMQNAISCEVVVRDAFTAPYLRISVKDQTEYAGRSIPAEGTRSRIRPSRRGRAYRRGLAWKCMAPDARKYPLPASEHALKRSCLQSWPLPTSTTNMARRKTLFRMKLLSEMHLRPRTCVSAKKDKPRMWAAVSPLRAPDRGYHLSAEG